MKVGILGAGPWGRALGGLAQFAGNEVLVGYRNEAPEGLPGTRDVREVAAFADLVCFAIPPSAVRGALEQAQLSSRHRVLLISRGFDPETGQWLSQLVSRASAVLRVGVLAGPGVAEELLAGRPGAAVVASPFQDVCRLTQDALHSSRFRVYPSHDLRGVELAGAAMEVLALAVGIVDGLELGAGLRGIVMARGLAEAARLADALGADGRTLGGLVGVGELVAATSSPDHRAYAGGRALATGGDVGRTEAVETAKAALALAEQHRIELPLCQAVAAIGTGRLSPQDAIRALMDRAAPDDES